MSAQATERLQQVVGEGYRLLEPAQKYTRAFCTDDGRMPAALRVSRCLPATLASFNS